MFRRGYYTKFIIVVDDHVDPTDIDPVIWAMATCCNPASDIGVLRNTWSTYLDFTKNLPEERPYGSKALIHACKEQKYLKTFSKRTRLTNDTYNQLTANWSKYEMPFEISTTDVFEKDVNQSGAPMRR